jgi:hypothetical protein
MEDATDCSFLGGPALIEPLVKLVLSKLDPLIDAYIERQRIILMIAVPGTLLFLLLFWAFSGAGGLMLILGLLLAASEVVLAGGIFLLHEKYKDEIQQWFDAADAIEAFLTNADVFSEWTQFLATQQEDPRLEQLRVNCTNLPKEYPPDSGQEYCGQEGLDLLDSYVRQLRVGVATKASEDFGKWWVAWRANRSERQSRKAEARAEAEVQAAAEREAVEAAARERAESAPAQSIPTLAQDQEQVLEEPPARKPPRKAPKPPKAARKQSKKTAKKTAKKKKKASRPARKKSAASKIQSSSGFEPATKLREPTGMVTEAAAIQQIMEAGFTAHDFDRKQEQIIKQRGRVPSPAEVVRGLMEERRGPGKQPKAMGGRKRQAAVKVKVRHGGGKVRWMRVVVVLGALAGAPFAAWRIPKFDSKPIAIVGEVHHQVLDQPEGLQHQLRTPFEEMFGNRAVNLVDGRRIYVSENDYKLCWPESWEAIFEKNYSMRISAEAKPLFFGGYSVAKITMVKRTDSPVATAR